MLLDIILCRLDFSIYHLIFGTLSCILHDARDSGFSVVIRGNSVKLNMQDRYYEKLFWYTLASI